MESYTTLVTCYFQLGKAKHSHNNYLQWIDNFLSNVKTPIIIFCDPESEEMIREKRKPYIEQTHIIVIKLEDFYTSRYLSVFRNNYLQDFEKDKHSVELYMVWAEKTEFLKKAMELNIFKSEFYVWIDIGAFRNRADKGDISLDLIKNWPDQEKMKALPKDKIILGRAGQFPPDCNRLMNNGLTVQEFTKVIRSIVGTIFIMHKDMILVWWKLYYWMLETFIKYNRPILKDQSIMANIAVAFPKKVLIIERIANLDPWFFMEYVFA